MESRAPAGRFAAALRWLAAPLGFAVTAVVATWPMVAKLGSHLPGYGPNTDNLFHLVFSRWFAVALGHGQNPYHVWWTLFPAGSDSFLGKNGTCFNAALSAPLQPLFGVLAAVNLTAMGLLAFNGWAAFRLVHHLTRHRAAAFLAGVVLMMVPYNASMLGALSYDQLSVGWALTFLLYLLRTVEDPGWRAPALAGLFFFLTCFSFLGYGLIFGGVGALVLAWMLIARRARPDRHLLGRLALAALLTGALCAPLALAFKLSGGASSVDPAAAGAFPIALAPSIATLAHHANRIVLDGSLRWRDVLALQGVAALLAAAGLILKPRRAALWAVLALGFYVLALGPYLKAGGHWVPLPGLVLYHLGGVFSRFRFPFRFVIVTWVAVAVLAGLGARALAQRWARTPRRAIVALAAVLAALAAETALRKDSLLPIPHFRAPEVPRYYREVLAQQPDAAVLSVPLLFEKPSKEAERAFPEPMWHPLEMYYQVYHGHRMMAGPETAVQPPPVFTAFARGSALVRNIKAWQQAADAAPQPIPERELLALDELGFGWVVLNERWLARSNADALRGYLEQIFGPPERYAEDGIAVWDVRGRGPLRLDVRSDDWLYPRSPAAEAALALAEEAFPVEPEGPEPWEEAGRLAIAAGEPEKAERYLARALELGSRNAELLLAKVRASGADFASSSSRAVGARANRARGGGSASDAGGGSLPPQTRGSAGRCDHFGLRAEPRADLTVHWMGLRFRRQRWDEVVEAAPPVLEGRTLAAPFADIFSRIAAVQIDTHEGEDPAGCRELAAVCFQEHWCREALPCLEALRDRSAAEETLLGRAYEALGWPSLALAAYRRALALDPAVEIDLSGVLVPDTAHPIGGRQR